jgi:hypothetical protein
VVCRFLHGLRVEDLESFGGRHPSPHTVRFSACKCVLRTLGEDRTGHAYTFRRVVVHLDVGARHVLRREEVGPRAIFALRSKLPIPLVDPRCRQ